MTASFIVAPAAEQDIIDIGSYIERESRNAALQLVSEIYDCFPKLAERPALGHRRPDLTNLPVRFRTLRRRYFVIYRDASIPIEIVRVLGTYRDVVALLDKSPE